MNWPKTPERQIITQHINDPLDEKEILVQFSKFPMIIEENHFLDTYETGYISTPDEKQEFHPAYIYNAVSADNNSNKELLSSIPAGRYVCNCFTAQNIQNRWQEVTNYLKQKKLQPRLILQGNLLNDVFASSNQYYEAQALL